MAEMAQKKEWFSNAPHVISRTLQTNVPVTHKRHYDAYDFPLPFSKFQLSRRSP